MLLSSNGHSPKVLYIEKNILSKWNYIYVQKRDNVAGERVHWQHSYQSTNVEMGEWHDVLLQVSIAGVLRLRKYVEQEAHLRGKGLYLFNLGFTLCAFITSYDKEKLVSINQRRWHWRTRRWVAGTLGVMAALGSWEVRMGYLCPAAGEGGDCASGKS